jgi:DHA1 family multidrug resistance protein-like MFS transporter
LIRVPAWLARLETLTLLYASVFLTRIGFGAIIIIFPLYIQAGPAVTAIVTAFYPAVEGISALPVGAYVDHRGRRRAFVVGMILVSILTLVIGLSNNIFLVAGAHGLTGLAAALITVSSLTMITDLTMEENRGAGMGAFNLSTLSGYGLGIVIGVVFAKIFNSSLGDSFIVVAAILAVAAVFAYFALREPPHTPAKRRSLGELYNNLTGDVAAIFPIWFALTIVLGFYLFIPKLVKNASADISQSAPLILLGLLVLGAGAVLFGRLSDKIGRTKTMIIGLLGEVGFLLVFPGIFDKIVLIQPGTPWLVTYSEMGPIIIVAAILFFLGAALLPTVLAYMADKATLGYRGATMGLYSLLLSAGIALGTVLAGFADQLAGVQGVFYSAVVILSGLGLTSGLLLRRGVTPDSTMALETRADKPVPKSKPI